MGKVHTYLDFMGLWTTIQWSYCYVNFALPVSDSQRTSGMMGTIYKLCVMTNIWTVFGRQTFWAFLGRYFWFALDVGLDTNREMSESYNSSPLGMLVGLVCLVSVGWSVYMKRTFCVLSWFNEVGKYMYVIVTEKWWYQNILHVMRAISSGASPMLAEHFQASPSRARSASVKTCLIYKRKQSIDSACLNTRITAAFLYPTYP